MLGNRDKRGEAHTWAQRRHASIRHLLALDVFMSAFAPEEEVKVGSTLLHLPLANSTSGNQFIQSGLVPYLSPINGIYLLFEKSQ